jgi:hypothetical protein
MTINPVWKIIFKWLMMFIAGNIFIACNFSSGQLSGTVKPQKEAWYKTIKEIPVPEGYERIAEEEKSFGGWLRNLSLKTENNTVYLFNGKEKWNQNAQFAVLTFDVGKRDLQQCADAVMRLRGEYLFSQKLYDDIHFNFLSDGKPRYFKDYAKGDHSHKKFRSYMDYVFGYANTASLSKELKSVGDLKDIMPGDVFVQTSNPYGHAVLVVDVAKEIKSGKKIFMIVQSYMPAQEIHVLKNPEDDDLSPWYSADFGEKLETPEWTFGKEHLKRF